MKRNKLVILIPVLIILLFASFVPSYAESTGGGDQASSPGIPGQKPLNLVSVTLKDGGSIDVPEGITTKPELTLTFDKNVVNMLYWENNSNCFSIASESGEAVVVRVTKIDDTVDFSQRQKIFVQPAAELKPGTSYVLKISPELTAKNGIKLGGSTAGEAITLSFKTEGQAGTENNSNQTSSKGNTTSSGSAVKPTPSVTPAKTTGGSASGKTGASAGYTGKSASVTGNSGAKAADATETTIGTGQDTTTASGTTTSEQTTAEAGTNAEATNSVSGVNSQDNRNNSIEGSKTSVYNWGIAVLILAVVCWIVYEAVLKRKKTKRG